VTRQPEELKNVSYEIFIAALSVISIANILFFYLTQDRDIAGVLLVMDWTFSFIFLVDFIMRLSLAKSKSTYFLRQFGWADLLSVAPSNWAQLLRIFRIVRTIRMMHGYGGRNIARDLKENISASAFLTVLLLIMLILEFGGIAIIKVESLAQNAQIRTAQDAMWFIWQTITTTGYGDVVPVTGEGRLVGIVVMSAGTALFGTLTGFLANAFLSDRRRRGLVRRSTGEEGDHSITLSEIRRLVNEQKHSQEELEAKIEELEKLLKKP
jgi:voltage-gated potassium channel